MEREWGEGSWGHVSSLRTVALKEAPPPRPQPPLSPQAGSSPRAFPSREQPAAGPQSRGLWGGSGQRPLLGSAGSEGPAPRPWRPGAQVDSRH